MNETKQNPRAADEEREYGRCDLCGGVFQYQDEVITQCRAGCGYSQGHPEFFEFESETKRFHAHCAPGSALAGASARIRELMSEKVRIEGELNRTKSELGLRESERCHAVNVQDELGKRLTELQTTCKRAYYELESHVNGRNPSTLTLRGVILAELKAAAGLL